MGVSCLLRRLSKKIRPAASNANNATAPITMPAIAPCDRVELVDALTGVFVEVGEVDVVALDPPDVMDDAVVDDGVVDDGVWG